MKNLREIMNEYDNEVTFPFLENNFVVTKERNIYNQLRLKYKEIANRAEVDFAKRLEKYSTPEALHKGVSYDFLYSLKEGFDEVTKDAISVDCYTFDMEAVTKLCIKKKYFDSFDKAVSDYKLEYAAILAKYLDEASNVYDSISNHPYLQTATIGGSLADVAANQMKTDMVNTVIGEIYAADATSQVANIADKSDKEVAKFFSDPTPKNKIIDAVWECAFNLRLVITNVLNEECDLKLSGWISNEDSTKAESMYNNLKSIQLPEEKEKELALSILQLNPLKYNYYKTFLIKYLDNAKEIMAIADFFCVNLSGAIKSILEEYAENNLGSSFDDIKKCRELVKAKISQLCFPTGSDELAENVLQKQSAVLLSDYLKNNMGETRAETLACFDRVLKIAEDIDFDEKYSISAYQPFNEKMEDLDNKLIEELNSWIDNNIGTTEDDAHKCREQLEKQINEQVLQPEKAVQLYQKIDDRLKKLDEEYRTVEGFTFPTRDSADETKAIIEQYKDILYKLPTEFIYRVDYTEQIERIKEVPLIEKLIAHFTSIYERHLKEFDKKCKNAKLHDDKLKGQKKSLKSLARSMFVSDDKQRQDWEEVTHNGQFPLNEIMGISEESNNPSGRGLKSFFGK